MSKRAPKSSSTTGASLNFVLGELGKFDESDRGDAAGGANARTTQLASNVRGARAAVKKAADGGSVGGASLVVWLASRVPRERVSFTGIDPASGDADSASTSGSLCVSESFLPIWCFLDDVEKPSTDAPRGWLARGPVKAVALPLDEATGATGNWSACMVIAYEARLERYIVSWSAGKRVGSPILHRSLICFEWDDCEQYAARLLRAVERRSQAEALLRASLYIESMPLSVDAQLDATTISNILSLTLASPSVPANAGTSSLLEEANSAYMYAMNKLVFETNARDMERAFPELALPQRAPPPPAPSCGVVAVARYDYNQRFLSVSSERFINLPFAVSAMLDLRKSCVDVARQRFLLDQQPTEISFGDVRATPKSVTLGEFSAIHAQMSHAALRSMRDSWTRLAAKRIQLHFGQAQHPSYNINEANRLKYLELPMRAFLRRVNYVVEDSLRDLIQRNFAGYTALIEEMAGFDVAVTSSSDVRVTPVAARSLDGDAPADAPPLEAEGPSSDFVPTHQPMFRLELVISAEKKALNQEHADRRAAEIREWCLANAQDRQTQCPLEPIAVEEGFCFEYATSPADFEQVIISQFDVVLHRLRSLELVERLVMDRIFWPNQDSIACLDTVADMVAALRQRVSGAVARATAPLLAYHAQFDSYVSLLNMDVDRYLRSVIRVQPPASSTPRDDGDDSEAPALVPPVELNELRRLLSYHRDQEAKILETIPARPVNMGLFLVDLTNIRHILAKKHRDIFAGLLAAQAAHCFQVATRIVAKFEEMHANLAATPKDIESLTALQEYIGGVPALLQPLQDEIAQMMKDNRLLDDFQHYASDEHLRLTWNAHGWPTKVTAQSARFKWALDERKGKFAKQMESEQERFEKMLGALQEEIESFARYDNLAFVDDVAHHALAVQKKLEQAQQDALLFNSRETLFGRDVTSYDALALAKKSFEPYNQLWATSHSWLQSRKRWIQGSFMDMSADEVEKLVESYSAAIQKAFKFFSTSGNDACTKIAETVKEQILVFKPYVPLITALRNPGMRPRHWAELSRNIGFELEIDESFTLTNIFQLNLLDRIDDIVKIAEAAGKEYQVEQALGVMKAAWDKIELQIVAYRETGTYVIKGVDEVQVVLDEHVTMTQAMMFSSFKGPFEDEIADWNATLQLISEVLEEWLAVQRNWLYLQPIFESPDINKQLPAEGKRFASVDKNWRQTLASAKAKPKCVEFCRSAKLLDKFRESNYLLELVQKGLSDYLEVKRSAFARFYFLSNDELLSILSESKDVKLVQPHLKKCFEGIVHVAFEDDLTISAMTSAEGETVQFAARVDPTGKNVEHWMMEVETMMKISVRDAMERAIVDYAKIDRTIWIQKWPGMCVLNGSQMHWTREMEAAMDTEGQAGVGKMMARQLGQLADMVTLVRGNLDKMARITCGALTVIDVHARDVTRKLVAQGVESKGDFLWSSQLKYYWENDLVIKLKTHKANLQPVPYFLTKCIQLYETIVVRHGLMVVGATGGGKSCNISVLAEALTELKQRNEAGFAFERVLVPTMDNNLAQSLTSILDCSLDGYREPSDGSTDAQQPSPQFKSDVEPLFMFALVWSVGATTTDAGRVKFDSFLRAEMLANNCRPAMPSAGLVYDYCYSVKDHKWLPWMDTVAPYKIPANTTFADIVVPTVDSVRNVFLLDALSKAGKHVLMVGGTGTGKTVNISRYLMLLPADVIIPIPISFSAQTSANQTQDLLDAKMEKRRKGVYGPPAGKKYIVYVDDLNMPKREKYFAQPPLELIRQWFDQSGWYDRKLLVFRTIVDVLFVASMGPPGGGRNPITPRLVRHFNVIGYAELGDESKTMIFATILGNFLSAFAADVARLTDRLVRASIQVYATICAELLPTPAKSHYTFNLRDLAKIFQGVLMCDNRRVTEPDALIRLWVHECKRVFEDRMVSRQDHDWFLALLQKSIAEFFSTDYAKVVKTEYLLYGDFLAPGADPKVYEEVVDVDKVLGVVEEYLLDYNAESKTPMALVLFMDAVEHVSRIARIIRQPMGNALLLGVGGSGRQSLTKLATYMAGYKCFQVEIVKGYGMLEWREDVKRCLLLAGIKDTPVVFLFSDVQVVNETMLEDLNGVLNAGNVPNLYGPEDMDQIVSSCRIECQKKQIPPTKTNIFQQYIMRVRRNIHLVVCMSPIGALFRDRLRMFPSLVNCSTIDWFSEWPAEALNSVATAILTSGNLNLGGSLPALVEAFKVVHQSVEATSKRFYDTLRRYFYVTPTSYLELLSTFKAVLVAKREEVNTMTSRLQNGVDKLKDTKVLVATMQTELVELQPVLAATQLEVEQMMVQIAADSAEADVTKATVEKEEAAATAKAAATKEIAASAQRDLDAALPALDAALECLNKLKKADIDEAKALKTPPSGVKLTMEVVCILFGQKPVSKPDPDRPGKKLNDYWEVAQKVVLSNANKFMESLLTFDKDNIPDAIVTKVAPYMEDPSFTPDQIEKSSKACTAICMWARAMYTYHFVARAVEPKKQALAEAQQELDATLTVLQSAQANLQQVSDRLAELERSYQGAVAKKEELAGKVVQCQVQLQNAEKLIGGLGGEEVRWKETVAQLEVDYANLTGDVLVSAGTISYLGAFTAEFREALVVSWREALARFAVPHSAGCDILLCDNGMDVVKQSDRNFLRTLENGLRFGKWVLLENVGEELDAALEPVLLQQKFKQGGQDLIRLGENVIPYNESFRFFLTTKLANPHYAPEVCVKVSLLNFTITMKGLEEQLLGVVVLKEMPDLAAKKTELMLSNAEGKKQLFEIENQILYLLSHSEGNILDDTNLIETLASAKQTSAVVLAKMKEAEETEKEIDARSDEYRPVAFRAALLFFCIADLAIVDPMYQYSLTWFTGLFVRAIQAAKPAPALAQRLESLNDYFTYSVYKNVCRSLFERHKLLFSFLLTIKIMQGGDEVDPGEWRFLISGMADSVPVAAENPAPTWLEAYAWNEACCLATFPAFAPLTSEFAAHVDAFRAIFDSPEPQNQPLPGSLEHSLGAFQRLCLLRVLRPDKMLPGMQNLVCAKLGKEFIEPPPFDLGNTFEDASPVTPLIFVLSQGSDPAKDLITFAASTGMDSKLKSIALGQGQGQLAARMIESATGRGEWVLLQNCHLALSWMAELERICEELDLAKLHPDFRLWLTSMPTPAFPASVLQDGVKMTKEAPKGLRANLKNTYYKLSDDALSATRKPDVFRKLLFGLCFYHAVVCERKRFGALGWNIPYQFNETDLDISVAQLEMFLDTYDHVPFDVLQVMTSTINYGGRITDDKDMRTSDVILMTFFTDAILESGYRFSRSGVYYSLACDRDNPYESYVAYINALPINPAPEVFGMHENADITCAQSETYDVFDIIVSLQPRVSVGTGKSREEIIADAARSIEARLPAPFDLEHVQAAYPVSYAESMNTVLAQEVERFNRLLGVMASTLQLVQKGLKGLIVMSAELEAMGNSLYDQKVPTIWESKAYPSLKPLGPWVKDLLERLDFVARWVEHGIPAVFWISGFFFPQGFMTGTIQNHARRYKLPIDSLSFQFLMLRHEVHELATRPTDGCYTYGLFIEGARWDKEAQALDEPLPRELFAKMPVIHLSPQPNREPPTGGIYRCPVYKILTRTGTLSTTGHSTNFVMWIEIPARNKAIWRNSLVSETNAQVLFCDQEDWIKAGVACFCSLRY
ncbi:hypothetical protein PybrP1_001177 [[Pythium] brassicae (nom. inval.)]|nr:hypothetical protein PybrP1_001177 [[Pythium] brassicae (nom. inval.)]